MYTITKKFKFESSHRLTLTYESPCQNFHGHSYKGEVSLISSELDDNGMVMDFSQLKDFQEWIDKYFDHATIFSSDDHMADEDYRKGTCYEDQKIFIMPNGFKSTAEHMCRLFASKVRDILKAKGMLFDSLDAIHINLAETENNIAGYTLNLWEKSE